MVLELALQTLLNALVDHGVGCRVRVLPLHSLQSVTERVLFEDVSVPKDFCGFLCNQVICEDALAITGEIVLEWMRWSIEASERLVW